MSSTFKKLKIYPFSLVLTSIKREQLNTCMHGLLKLLLFPERSKDRFLSFTDTGDEISLVIEEKDLLIFPSNTLEHTNQTWRAIKIDEGPLGFEATGIVSSIAQPLSQHNIFIYYISTFQTDYTLVQYKDLQAAIATLESAGFEFTKDPVSTSHLYSPSTSQPLSQLTTSGSNTPEMVVTKLPQKLCLTQFPRNWSESLSKSFIQAVFFPNPNKAHFISITETPEETSVIIDEDTYQIFPEKDIQKCSFSLQALQICEGAYGSHETGIVGIFSQPLAEAHISIFNLSTYLNDYTLVKESNVDLTVEKLREKFQILLCD